ncbi:MAG: hypothetical protein IIV99_02450, partial [Oscillospiraceae bacterium]|nr:hypothetical protein [Oscillospiraceae bacterium]
MAVALKNNRRVLRHLGAVPCLLVVFPSSGSLYLPPAALTSLTHHLVNNDTGSFQCLFCFITLIVIAVGAKICVTNFWIRTGRWKFAGKFLHRGIFPPLDTKFPRQAVKILLSPP